MTTFLQGHFDHITGRVASGWVWNPENPAEMVTVELWGQGRCLSKSVANLMRDELQGQGLGTGHYGYALIVPQSLCDGQSYGLQVQVAGTAQILPGGPHVFRHPAGANIVPLPMALLNVGPLRGQLDAMEDGRLIGWVMDTHHPDTAVRLALYDGERFVASTLANQHRADVEKAGLGTGLYGFQVAVPPSLKDGQLHHLTLRQVGTAQDLLPLPIPYIISGAASATVQNKGYKGKVEVPSKGMMRGWVWNARQPDARWSVDILLDDVRVATVLADQERPDLQAAGIGDGRYGITWPIPDPLCDGQPHRLNYQLSNGEYAFTPQGITVQMPEARTGRPPLVGSRPFALSQTVPAVPAPALAAPAAKVDGSIDLPGYLDQPGQVALLASLPLEHRLSNLSRMEASRVVDRLLNRLKRERLASVIPEAPLRFGTTLVLLVDEAQIEQARHTMGVWALQSHPAIHLTCLASSPHVGQTLTEAGIPVLDPTDPAQWSALCQQSRYIAFARAGDSLHPSLATILARRLDDAVIVWNMFSPDSNPDQGGWLYRRTRLDQRTACLAGYVDTGFAARGVALADMPAPVLAALAAGNAHLPLFWLATRGQTIWDTHPEALTIRSMPAEVNRRPILERDMALYEQLALSLPSFSLERTATDLPMPFVLVPVQRARRISVLLCYRDHAAMTLRCVHSIARQRVTGSVELVLINNQSQPAEQAEILRGSQALFAPQDIVCLSYDAPFNHSAQNNLGAEQATGDVIVICNNDMILRDDTLLEEIAAWALLCDTGIVSCQVLNTINDRGAYGHRVRTIHDDPFSPVLGENDDPTYRDYLLPVPGNSLCLGAMARDRFLAMGGLDAVAFPIGYNDVDFALRCRAQGLVNLYLGHLRADHERGSSRTGDNEDLQSLMIRAKHPIITQERLFQTQRERLGPPGVPGKGKMGLAASPPSADSLARQLLAARQQDEQQATQLAEALIQATGHLAALQRQLDSIMKGLANP